MQVTVVMANVVLEESGLKQNFQAMAVSIAQESLRGPFQRAFLQRRPGHLEDKVRVLPSGGLDHEDGNCGIIGA